MIEKAMNEAGFSVKTGKTAKSQARRSGPPSAIKVDREHTGNRVHQAHPD